MTKSYFIPDLRLLRLAASILPGLRPSAGTPNADLSWSLNPDAGLLRLDAVLDLRFARSFLVCVGIIPSGGKYD